ncbi:hypothetical protein F4604DRAFT_1834651 [Suillus subluteus]|nr:hypothetical protein F4604DRAFT_1834651 [Suillus subluteus]
MCSSLACPHFCLDSDSTPMRKQSLIPQPLWVHVQMRLWISCPNSSALDSIPTKKSNFRNAQVVLMLSKWFQCGTGRYCLLLHGRNPLSLVVLCQVQELRIHYPSDCWLISYFLSAARLLNTLMVMHNRHSSSKVNRKVQSRPKPTAPSIADSFRSFSLLCISPACRRALILQYMDTYLIW